MLVAAVGKANFVQGDWIKPGAIVIDVGMNRGAEGKLCGDVDIAAARARGVDHAGARRRRPDDDRDAASEHTAGRGTAGPRLNHRSPARFPYFERRRELHATAQRRQCLGAWPAAERPCVESRRGAIADSASSQRRTKRRPRPMGMGSLRSRVAQAAIPTPRCRRTAAARRARERRCSASRRRSRRQVGIGNAIARSARARTDAHRRDAFPREPPRSTTIHRQLRMYRAQIDRIRWYHSGPAASAEDHRLRRSHFPDSVAAREPVAGASRAARAPQCRPARTAALDNDVCTRTGSLPRALDGIAGGSWILRDRRHQRACNEHQRRRAAMTMRPSGETIVRGAAGTRQATTDDRGHRLSPSAAPASRRGQAPRRCQAFGRVKVWMP